ncbi:putative quinol monooxygenase [Luteolibacter sp. SL250]|uniref:putative quinol monooxygenase n=1 Tax=Luteolibacter sp. SL250 TaxID=2995170 RepID=UPI00226D6E53|nr:putative quinol monooxygenase [Luteolibacter sp. SL250]WAC19762.1 putative quinol monooxygenase [Luteolibacter sp. SL250]
MMTGLKSRAALLGAILASLTSQLPAEELALWVKVSLKPEIHERYIVAVQKNVEETRKEPSSPRFDFYQDTASPGVFHQFEVWKDQAALDDHLKQPYVKASWKVRDEGETAPKEVIKMAPYRATTTAKAPDGDLSGSQNVIVVFQPEEQLKEEFLSEFDKVIEGARKADGNLAFELYRTTDPAGKFVLFERWASPADYAKHLSTPYVAAFYKHFEALVENRVRHFGKDLSVK